MTGAPNMLSVDPAISVDKPTNRKLLNCCTTEATHGHDPAPTMRMGFRSLNHCGLQDGIGWNICWVSAPMTLFKSRGAIPEAGRLNVSISRLRRAPLE